MDRRQFLSTAGAAAGLSFVSAFASKPALAFAASAQAAAGPKDAALNQIFDRIFQEQVSKSKRERRKIGRVVTRRFVTLCFWTAHLMNWELRYDENHR